MKKNEDTKNSAVLPLLPLRDMVIFPLMMTNITVGRPSSLKLIEDIRGGDDIFCAVKQKDHEVDEPKRSDLYSVGTVCRIQKIVKFPDKTQNILVQGLFRVRLGKLKRSGEPYLMANTIALQEKITESDSIDALKRLVLNKFIRMQSMSPYLSDELHTIVLNIDHPGKFADFVISNIVIPMNEKQLMLAICNVEKRLAHLSDVLSRELELLELGSKIEDKVRSEMDKTQRDYVLREQLEAIRKELGDDADIDPEVLDLEKKIKKTELPADVRSEVERELSRFKTMGFASPEYTLSRTYLEWIVDLPWAKYSKDNLDINRAKTILDRDHFNLKKVKERILEFLAVRKLRDRATGSILCFAGPPGVGKTSLGKSIARALGREFVRVSLGGVRDEADIRGHRRTYIGALPGKIIQGMKRAGTSNPVFMLDEIDKVSSDFRGDPSSALLEVLDPEQNSSFMDHFLDLPFDLSNVMFIATANMIDTVLPALRDRLEIIEIPGYTIDEKGEIAWKYLLPRLYEKTGIERKRLSITRKVVERVIVDYTREAGVRNLERELAGVFRKVARKITQDDADKVVKHKITSRNIAEYLGPAKFYYEVAERLKEPGISVGLAWTETGGEIMFIESTKMKGAGKLLLTGQLGDVMRESAQAALSIIKSNASKFKLEDNDFSKLDIHIHVPAGAIPKDGPSAGIAMLVSLYSLFCKKPVRSAVAMTGEITLRGKIMPIGGIKEKILAAARCGIVKVIIPAENKKDMEDIPKSVQEKMEFLFVNRIEEVLQYMF